MAKAAAAAVDDDLTQGPDDPNATVDPDADGLDLDVDPDDEEDEEDDPAAAAEPTAAQLKADLDRANAQLRKVAAAATLVRRKAALKKDKTRTPPAATKPAPAPAQTEEQLLAALPPELKREFLAARKAAEDAQAKLAEQEEAAKEKDLHAAVNAALLESGLRLPADADEKRKTLKRIFRTLDLSGVEVDADGDLVGIEDEIDIIKDLMPTLFAPAVDPAANGAPKPKARINPGGGRQQPSGAGEKTYANTAEFLVSSEYKRRNMHKQA